MKRATGLLVFACAALILPIRASAAHAESPAGTAETPSSADAAAAAEDAAPRGEPAKSLELHASGEAGHPPEIAWSFDGPFGTYDRASLQRGFQVYSQVCSACHSMSRLSYRNLTALGYTPGEVKAIAASHTVQDGPNDEGEMFERPGLPSDRFVSPFPNVKAAAAANNGAAPPDMSLLAKARHGGASYIYGILTGYAEPPAGHALLPGQHWNKYMPGNVIAMPQPLQDGQVAYEDGSPQTLDQYARDVSTFLAWASEPHMEERKRTGVKALMFLLVFTGVMYGVKRKLWAKIH